MKSKKLKRSPPLKIMRARKKLEAHIKAVNPDMHSIVYKKVAPPVLNNDFEAYMCQAPGGMKGRYYMCRPDAHDPSLPSGPDMRYLRAGCAQRGTACRMVRVRVEDLGAGIVATVNGASVREL